MTINSRALCTPCWQNVNFNKKWPEIQELRVTIGFQKVWPGFMMDINYLKKMTRFSKIYDKLCDKKVLGILIGDLVSWRCDLFFWKYIFFGNQALFLGNWVTFFGNQVTFFGNLGHNFWKPGHIFDKLVHIFRKPGQNLGKPDHIFRRWVVTILWISDYFRVEIIFCWHGESHIMPLS